MIAIAKIFLLVGVVKLLINFEKPVLCSSIYAIGSFILLTMLGLDLGRALVLALIEFGVATLMFALMNRSEGVAWWTILIAGVLLLGVV